MKIELWTDILCEYCYLGTRYLELALKQLPELSDVTIHYHSYELDPNADIYNGKHIKDILIEYGMTPKDVEQHLLNIEELCSEVDLTINFDTMKSTNTLNAHRLVKYAKTFQK